MPKPTVLHFRNTFLRPSETFIARVVHNHQRYTPLAVGIRERDYVEGITSEFYSGSKLGVLTAALQFAVGRSPSLMNTVVANHQPNVIHAHFGQDGYLMVPTARDRRLPLVVSFYGKDVTQLPTQWIWRRRYRSLADGATLIIAASNRMKEQLVILGFEASKIRVVRFGLDMSSYSRREQNGSGNRLMMIGRFVEKKGMEYAINAFSLLADRYPGLSLDIFGEGERENAIRALVDHLGLANRITIRGFVPTEQVGSLMRQYDILVVPSVTAANNDQEGLPNVIIEGMACGVAVVASSHAAIPEIVLDGKTGFLTDERDPLSIATGVARLVDDADLRKRIVSEASDFVRREHALEKTVAEIEDVYDEAVAIVANR